MWDGFYVGWHGWGCSCAYSDDRLSWWDAYLHRERLKGEPSAKSLVCTAYPKRVGRKPTLKQSVDLRLCRSGYRRTHDKNFLTTRAGGTQTAPSHFGR